MSPLHYRKPGPARLPACRLAWVSRNQPGPVPSIAARFGLPWREGAGLYPSVAGGWSQPDGHVGSEAGQPVPPDLDQRTRHSGVRADAACRAAYGQAGADPFDVHGREQSSPGYLLCPYGPPPQSGHGIPEFRGGDHQGTGRAGSRASARPGAAVGEPAAV